MLSTAMKFLPWALDQNYFNIFVGDSFLLVIFYGFIIEPPLSFFNNITVNLCVRWSLLYNNNLWNSVKILVSYSDLSKRMILRHLFSIRRYHSRLVRFVEKVKGAQYSRWGLIRPVYHSLARCGFKNFLFLSNFWSSDRAFV